MKINDITNHLSHETVYDVAVIMINYNSSEYTINCINSILDNTDSVFNYQIIVIDNASENNDYINLSNKLNSLESNQPILSFRSRINLGFSGGNMLGVQFSNAKYYFFLNNDCLLQNDCLKILFEFSESNRQAALCSPQLYLSDNKIQPCIDFFPSISTKIFGIGIQRLFYGKRFFKRKSAYTSPTRVDVVSGSQMFANAEAFNAIGGFDTTFFLYCEEEDIALRLHRRGYHTYLVPDAKNKHIGGMSTPRSSAIKREFYISFLYFYRKHYGIIKTQLLKLVLSLSLLRKTLKTPSNIRLIFFIIRGAALCNSLRHQQSIVNSQPEKIQP